MGFATLEELQKNVRDHAIVLHDQAVAKQIADKKEAEAKEKAEKKLSDITSEVVMEGLKIKDNAKGKEGFMAEIVDQDLPSLEIKNMEVIDPYQFPTDLGIDSDIEGIAEIIKEISQTMQKDVEIKTDTMQKIWLNFNSDLLNLIDQYSTTLSDIQEAKSIAE